jgi:hypothetical protein
MVTGSCQPTYGGKIVVPAGIGKIKTLSPKYPVHKGLEAWLEWYSTCQESGNFSVQNTVPQKKMTKRDYI